MGAGWKGISIVALGLLAGCLAGSLALAADAQSSPQARDSATPLFEQQPCNLPGVTPAVASRLRCGVVRVPRDRERPEAGRLALAVVTIKGLANAPAAPILYIHGGPAAALTTRAAELTGATGEGEALAPGRSLVLVDQRGSGRSEPHVCPDLAGNLFAITAEGLTPKGASTAVEQQYARCREELKRQNVDPAWFGARASAEDFEDVRRALSIGKWNLYARSYGTRIAMTLIALHPATIASAVLDSVYPPEPLPISQSDARKRALQFVFAVCQNDPACNAAYPNLAQTFNETYRALEEVPLPVTMPTSNGPMAFNLRGSNFYGLVLTGLYRADMLRRIPQTVIAAHERRPEPLVEPLTFDRTLALMTNRVVARIQLCRDGSSAQFCAGWVSSGPPPIVPHISPVPIVLLAGTFDPATPREFARSAKRELGMKAAALEIAESGHDVVSASPCAARIVAGFFRGERVDTGCMPRTARIRFVLPPAETGSDQPLAKRSSRPP